ncbi:RNA-directed DNA polymerase, eukaryota [Tanacetum coccineum]
MDGPNERVRNVYKGFKQGDRFIPFFSLSRDGHTSLSFQRIVTSGMFKVLCLDQSFMSVAYCSKLASDAIFCRGSGVTIYSSLFTGSNVQSSFKGASFLDLLEEVTVNSKIAIRGSFRRIPRGGIEQNQFDSLVELVRSVTIVPSADRWNWNLESTGIFSVASARRRIDEICLPNIGEETRWVKCVPIKINVLAWKIKTDALPTRFNISRRGIDIQDMSCPICDNAIESTDHLFFRCGLVRDIANKVLSWWNLDHANLNSYAEWKSWLVSIRMDSKLKKMFEGVWIGVSELYLTMFGYSLYDILI